MIRAILSQIILSTAKSKSNNFLYGIVVLLIFVFNGNTATEKMTRVGLDSGFWERQKGPGTPPPSTSFPMFQANTNVPVGVKLYSQDTGLNSETFTFF